MLNQLNWLERNLNGPWLASAHLGEGTCCNDEAAVYESGQPAPATLFGANKYYDAAVGGKVRVPVLVWVSNSEFKFRFQFRFRFRRKCVCIADPRSSSPPLSHPLPHRQRMELCVRSVETRATRGRWRGRERGRAGRAGVYAGRIIAMAVASQALRLGLHVLLWSARAKGALLR